MKKILIIGPFPGNLNGQTIANQIVYDKLKKIYDVDRINTLKEIEFSNKSEQGKFIFNKFLKIIKELFKEIKQIMIKKYDVIYMTSGQSFLGFMRFSPYMLICILKNIPYYNHIHGGYFRKMYDSKNTVKQNILKYFIKKSSGMIVLGKSLKLMFEDIIPTEKIYVCENGIQDEVVATQDEINKKMENSKKKSLKNVLYLSNLMREKGILDLLKAIEKFDSTELQLNLAGAIEPSIENEVKKYLIKYPNKIKYFGVVKGIQKRKILLENDIFILPSYDEGQPLSILEAYATGCAVITDQEVGGIKDIFENKINGLNIKSKDIENISKKIKEINSIEYIEINYNIFLKKYQSVNFVSRIEKILFKGSI